MKNIVLVSVLSVYLTSGFAHEATGSHDNTLSINLTNTTSNLCVLTNSYLHLGCFFLNAYIPEYIPPYSSSAPIVLNSDFSAALELSYSCGENKNITFSSKVDTGWFVDTVSAGILSANHMMAEYQIVLSVFHNTINWRFKEGH